MNTRIEYMYRDAGNYKQFGEVVVKGRLRLEDIEPYLYDGQFFIPEEVGLKGLQPLFTEQGFDYPTEDDHEWHEFVGFENTDAAVTLNITADEIIERFKKIKK